MLVEIFKEAVEKYLVYAVDTREAPAPYAYILNRRTNKVRTVPFKTLRLVNHGSWHDFRKQPEFPECQALMENFLKTDEDETLVLRSFQYQLKGEKSGKIFVRHHNEVFRVRACKVKLAEGEEIVTNSSNGEEEENK